MHKLLGAVPIVMTACATVSTGTPVHGVTPGHACSTDATAKFIGQPATQESGDAILRASNAAVVRWAPPGVMLTMDFREDRVTVRTGPDGRITAISCG